MSSNNDPAYVVDLDDRRNWRVIDDLQPGQEVSIFVKLAPSSPPVAAVRAKGARTVDGKFFVVSVETLHGEDTHTCTWEVLQDALCAHRRKAK